MKIFISIILGFIFPSNLTDLEQYYKKRLDKTKFIDKLCFWGTTSHRPILEHFNKSLLVGPNYIGYSDKIF